MSLANESKAAIPRDPAIAAINFTLKCECPLEFLRCWREGNWKAIRLEWPECPIDCFIDEADYTRYPAGEAIAE